MPQPPAPPFTPIEEVVDEPFGIRVPDPYRWLEDSQSPRVAEWTAAQVARTRAHLDALPGRPAVERRLREALDCGSLGAVLPRGRWRFFARRGPGMNQAALHVLDAGGAERLLVDPAPMSPDAATALDWYHPSPDGELVAFGISEAGTEDSVLRVLETATGDLLDLEIPRCRLATVAFEPGNRALLYTRFPLPGEVPSGEENYHRRLFRHEFGAGEPDQLLFGRSMLEYTAMTSFSADGRLNVLVCSQGWSRTNAFLRTGAGGFEPFFDGPDHQVEAWFAKDRLLARTNFQAPNYRLVEIDPRDPRPESWTTVIPESDHALVAVGVARDHLVVHHLVTACSRVSVHSPGGAFEREVELPAHCTVTAIGADAGLADVYLTVEEFTRPAVASRLEPGTGRTQPVLGLRPPSGFDPARHPVRQVHCTSPDGTRVPLFLIGRPAGEGPTVLTGYGGFNVSRTPAWSPDALPLLEAGGLLCVANLRGGGEFGEPWHRAGMLAAKQNVFDDFVAAAEHLVASGLATPRTLAIYGRSNGGLLVGAAMTQRPELFAAVWCGVPLLDMVRYERFQVARLWAAEYGSAEDPEQLRWLLSYSPYHRVVDGTSYPPVLLTTAEGDTRVDPMHARKMAARLQAADPAGRVFLRLEERAGHGQGKPVAKLVEEDADAWAFLLDAIGPSSPPR